VSALERRLHDALTGTAEAVAPAPDLFRRVTASVADDRRARRRRRALGVGAGVAGLALIMGLWWGMTRAASVTHPDQGGGPVSWWVLELGTTVALVALALWLGPFIKRFGRAYAADVFHDNPGTGKSYIVLADIVYYLIFAAYILMTVTYAPRLGWGTTVGAEQLAHETVRVGGILLIIGVLHGLNILTMPLLGRLFSLNRRVDRR
jgi:hypothetical protein